MLQRYGSTILPFRSLVITGRNPKNSSYTVATQGVGNYESTTLFNTFHNVALNLTSTYVLLYLSRFYLE